MGACLVVLGGLLLTQVVPTDFFGNARAKEDMPPLAGRDESQEKSFAGQIHTDVRGPFGDNPYEKYINDFQMLQNPVYPKRYQRNIYMLRSQEPHWELDAYFNSSLNNFNNWVSSEAPYAELSKFWDQRKINENQWRPRSRV
jgi:hypothetical protein